MKRIISLTLSVLMGMYAIHAQEIEENAAVREILDNMYENLDKSKVPTGLLLDYAFDLVDFDRYDGSELSDSNFVERTTFECLLRSIRSAAVGMKPFEDVSSIMERMADGDGNTINIGLLVFKYNYIREDALERNLIRYENDMVYDCYDNEGNWVNPYAEKHVIGFSSFNYVSESTTVNIAFPSKFIFFNTLIKTIEFDAGDGNGFVTVAPGSSLSISYDTGIKELKMRVTLGTGEILVCHSQLICGTDHIKMNSQASPGNDKYSNPDETKEFYYTFGGKSIKARASVFYATANTDKKIKKPFVYVEGFDPVELKELCVKMGIDSSGDEYDSGYTTAKAKYYEIFKLSKNTVDNYDIIYIDWLNCEADIRDNARLLMQILEWINTEKVNSGSDEKNIVMGESMGGLIARYALRKMELEAKSHEATAYISLDSPHLGAHVPLGALYGIHELLIFYYGGGIGVDIAKLALKASSAGYVLRKYL
ncbi:MAG: putative lipase, partial [Clostridium sp.]|nr:putative lipase [Clostridium sp.]